MISRANKKDIFSRPAESAALLQDLSSQSDYPVEQVPDEMQQSLRDSINSQFKSMLPIYKASLDIFKA